MTHIKTFFCLLYLRWLHSRKQVLGANRRDQPPVVSVPVLRTIDLPGEFLPFPVGFAAREGCCSYVDRVLVDRGSIVNQGDLLAEMSAPEMAARIAEAQSKVQAAEADRVQAEAQLAASKSTYDGLEDPRRTRPAP